MAHPSRLRPFSLLWSASVISALGDGVHWVALPLLAARGSTDPRVISLVTVAEQLPWLLFGLLAGALADRLDRRRTLWIGDLVRAVVVAGFTLTVAVGHVPLAAILAVAFVLTSATTLHDSASSAYLPSTVAVEDRPAANSRLQAGILVTGTLLGPPLGAILFSPRPGWLRSRSTR